MRWRRRVNSSEQFRLFYVSDLHGSDLCFRKFLNAAAFYRVQALVLGGDLTGKAVVPIISRGTFWDAEFLGERHKLVTEEEVAKLNEQIRFNGFYPWIADPEQVTRMSSDDAYAGVVFEQLMRESVQRWMDLADERLEGKDVAFCAIAGNDDELYIDDILRASEVTQFNDDAVVDLGTALIVGSSYSNPTPWDSPRELPEDTLYERLRATFDTIDRKRPLIVNLHAPPHASGLDDAPELTSDLSLKLVGGQPSIVPVGSTAVRRIIEEVQPILGLHGHIHESRAVAKVGETLVVNPGSRYNEGVLDGVIVTLEDGRVTDYQLVTG